MSNFFTVLFLCLTLVPKIAIAIPAPYVSSDGNAVIQARPVLPLDSRTIDANLISSNFPGWSVLTGAFDGFGGFRKGPCIIGIVFCEPVLTVDTYGAIQPTKMTIGWGLRAYTSLQLYYPPYDFLNWIQIVSTNDPKGLPTKFVDTVGNTTSPLYPAIWSTPYFQDGSARPIFDLATHPDGIDWSADLYPVRVVGNQEVLVADGLSWGWTLKPTLQGRIAGFLDDILATVDNATLYTFGSDGGSLSSVSFKPNIINPQVGQEFSLGTVAFHNGNDINIIDAIDFGLKAQFDNLSDHDISIDSRLSITSNIDSKTGNSSNSLHLQYGDLDTAFSVSKGDTATANLMAVITAQTFDKPDTDGGATSIVDLSSDGAVIDADMGLKSEDAVIFSLKIVGWDNVSPGGFLNTTIMPTEIPEPSMTGALVVGVVGLVLVRIGNPRVKGRASGREDTY